ncbi:MAG: GFA family protein [Pseudomonadota bacterium]
MAIDDTTISGGCLCGAIRFQAHGRPEGAGYCHCASCRRHTGAPVAAFVVFVREQVDWTTGARGLFDSSPGVRRAFCRDCGSSLTWEARHRGTDLVEIHISALDDPDAFAPNEHTHWREKIGWLQMADDLPRHDASMP